MVLSLETVAALIGDVGCSRDPDPVPGLVDSPQGFCVDAGEGALPYPHASVGSREARESIREPRGCETVAMSP